jgi:phage recombination protein Bet
MEVLRKQIAPGLSESELELFLAQAERKGLDPLAGHIIAQKRWDATLEREQLVFYIKIDGLRLIAERTGKYAGQLGPFWCGEDGEWKDVWLSDEPPAAAKVGVLRSDFKEPIWGVARFSSYAQFKKDGKLNRSWAKMPDLMLAKCAEALALRRAFPAQTAGLYLPEELKEDLGPEPEPEPEPEPQVSEPEPEPEPEPQVSEPEPEPEPEPQVSEPEPEFELDEKAQRKRLVNLISKELTEMGFVTKKEFLDYIHAVVGRKVKSSNDLSLEELAKVLEEVRAIKKSTEGEIWDGEVPF